MIHLVTLSTHGREGTRHLIMHCENEKRQRKLRNILERVLHRWTQRGIMEVNTFVSSDMDTFMVTHSRFFGPLTDMWSNVV